MRLASSWCRLAFLLAGFQLISAPVSVAGGFSNDLQSASGAAVARAGVTAEADDASTVFYNPAGMAQLPRAQIVVGSAFINPETSFENKGSTDSAGSPLRGNTSTRDTLQYLPSVFGVVPVGNNLRLGLGVYAPFGSRVTYDANWVGRYDTTKSALTTVEVMPSVSYQALPWLSVGLGVGAQYAELSRDNAIDFGSVCLASALAAACPGLGLTPQSADGQARLDVSDWAPVYAFGVVVQPSPTTKLGLAYRSEVTHTLSGSARFAVPSAAQILTNGGATFQNTSATTKLTLPQSVSLGGSWKAEQDLTLRADATWTNWSRLGELNVSFGNPSQPAVTQQFKWSDSYRIAVGAVYQVSEAMAVRAGIAYDESPVTAQFRSADLPQNDRVLVGIGADYHLSDTIKLVISYDYQREMNAPVNFALASGGTLAGEFHSQTHILGLQADVGF
jgi:long-chain fatty acid transport protein